MTSPTPATLDVRDVCKDYGATRVLHHIALEVSHGELLGLAGHNGAGKSTLLNIIAGYTAPDEGDVYLSGQQSPQSAAAARKFARDAGIQIVRQELALCPALSVAESAAVLDRSAHGWRWRARAWARLSQALDDMFGNHRLRPGTEVGQLSVSDRQMLECAGAVVAGGANLRLLILDEPTSSLDRQAAESLYAYLRRRADEGMSAIVTTHRLSEMIANLDRIVVLRDGRHAGEAPTSAADANQRILELMGEEAARAHSASGRSRIPPARTAKIGDTCVTITDDDGQQREIKFGEIVGLGGLEGHGQRELLRAVYAASSGRRARTRHQTIAKTPPSAYISGDRGTSGIFRYWSVTQNLSIASLKSYATAGMISQRAENALTDQWKKRLDIRARGSDGITNLSGGNQQKVLISRALATGNGLLLLEDPFRGVDQQTKCEAYELLREQAGQGKCIIWYSSEIEEYQQCDRLIVFREGQIIAELGVGKVEDRQAVIAASFAETVPAGKAV